MDLILCTNYCGVPQSTDFSSPSSKSNLLASCDLNLGHLMKFPFISSLPILLRRFDQKKTICAMIWMSTFVFHSPIPLSSTLHYFPQHLIYNLVRWVIWSNFYMLLIDTYANQKVRAIQENNIEGFNQLSDQEWWWILAIPSARKLVSRWTE